jgi:hypothetical protein
MKRWLFTILSALSLVTWLVAIVLWLRAFSSRGDTFGAGSWAHQGDDAIQHVIYFDSDGSVFGITMRREDALLSASESTTWDRQRPPPILQFGHGRNRRRPFAIWSNRRGYTFWRRIGFEYRVDAMASQGFHTKDRVISVPFWFVLLLLAAAPAVYVIGLIRTHRRCLSHQCPNCGYDPRATPDHCPECGAVPAESIA